MAQNAPSVENKKDGVQSSFNTKTFWDHVKTWDVRHLTVFALGSLGALFLIICQPILDAITILLSSRLKSKREQQTHHASARAYCKTTAPLAGEGILDSRVCPKTGRKFLTRCCNFLGDLMDVAAVFASGFAVDPFSNFLNPQHWIRHRFSSMWYLTLLQLPSSDCIVEEWEEQEKIVGAMLITQRNTTFWEDVLETASVLSYLFKMMLIAPRTASRMLCATLALAERQDRISACYNGRLCVLKYLAVEKGFQGQGIGSQLMKTLVKHADALQLVCYLESSAAVNIPLYERFGFRFFEEFYCAPASPPLYLMIRHPTSPENDEGTTTAPSSQATSSMNGTT